MRLSRPPFLGTPAGEYAGPITSGLTAEQQPLVASWIIDRRSIMSKIEVAVVTDSTAFIPDQLVFPPYLHVIPQVLNWEGGKFVGRCRHLTV